MQAVVCCTENMDRKRKIGGDTGDKGDQAIKARTKNGFEIDKGKSSLGRTRGDPTIARTVIEAVDKSCRRSSTIRTMKADNSEFCHTYRVSSQPPLLAAGGPATFCAKLFLSTGK